MTDAESAALARDFVEKRGGSIEPAFFAAIDQVTRSHRGAVRRFLETWIPKPTDDTESDPNSPVLALHP